MTPLRQRMIEKLELRNYSPKTVKAYVAAVAQFAQHFHRSPDLLNAEQIRLWQLHLRDTRKVSWSAFNIFMCALRFFYREVVERQDLIPRLAFMRRESAPCRWFRRLRRSVAFSKPSRWSATACS